MNQLKLKIIELWMFHRKSLLIAGAYTAIMIVLGFLFGQAYGKQWGFESAFESGKKAGIEQTMKDIQKPLVNSLNLGMKCSNEHSSEFAGSSGKYVEIQLIADCFQKAFSKK